jgi:hypothetical protein
VGRLRILSLNLLVFALVPTILMASDYQKNLDEGLKAEARGDFVQATASFVKAYQADPKKSVPRDRIIMMISDWRAKGRSLAEIEKQLPVDLHDDLVRRGILSRATEKASQTSVLYQALAALGILLLITVVILVVKHRSRAEQVQNETTSIRRKTQKPSPNPSAGASAAVNVPRKEATVTPRMREEISELISRVRSIPESVQQERTDESEKQQQILEESGVLQALAQTLVSEVEIDQTEQGKYSKLSIDALLLFDEEIKARSDKKGK